MPSIAGCEVLELLVAVAVGGVGGRLGLADARRTRRSTRSGRSPEWIASVMIATEPVTRAGHDLEQDQPRSSRRSRAPRRARRGEPGGASRQRLGSHASSLPDGAPAVGDRVLLGVGELGHRAAVRRRRRARTPGRSRSRRSPRGAARHAALAAALERAARAPSGLDVGDRADVAQARAGAAPRRAACARFSASVASSPAKRAERTPGRAAERLGLDAGVVGDRGARRWPRPPRGP